MNKQPYEPPVITKYDTNTNDVRINEQVESISEKILNDMDKKILNDEEK